MGFSTIPGGCLGVTVDASEIPFPTNHLGLVLKTLRKYWGINYLITVSTGEFTGFLVAINYVSKELQHLRLAKNLPRRRKKQLATVRMGQLVFWSRRFFSFRLEIGTQRFLT